MAIMQLTLIECLMCASYSRTQTLIAFLYIKKDCPQGDSLKEYSFHCYSVSLKNASFETNDFAVYVAAVDRGEVFSRTESSICAVYSRLSLPVTQARSYLH